MKASLSWINEYTPVKLNTPDLVAALTMVGLEVDSVMDRFAHLASVVVGRVMDVSPHPKADRLNICKVDIGEKILTIVCGAPNVKKDILVPVALPGTIFDNDKILAESTIRGIASQGMICSEKELNLGQDGSGILHLPSDLVPGVPIPLALSLSDKILDIDLTPNRSDCLSVIGIAREIAAIQNTALKLPKTDCASSGKGSVFEKTSVTINAPDHCPRYAARLLDNITVGPSPAWLQDRLISVGLRPINNVVDITNFVMMETGQPLHAFDFDQLAENRIVVRTATPGEIFQTLDNKSHTLDQNMLMICDGQKPVAIGGVMGGQNSEIQSSTRRVLLESACFSPMSIRKTAKRLGINSDASHRFERGVDPEGTVFALNRAAGMLAEICQATLLPGIIDVHPGKKSVAPILLHMAQTNRLLGTAISQNQAKSLLESIGFAVSVKTPDQLEVLPPTFRVDIKRQVDLIEEIARLYGYDRIPTTFPAISPQSKIPKRDLILRNKIKSFMTALGFSEAVNYSFTDGRSWDLLHLPDNDPRRKSVKILNPLSEDQTEMRTMILPNLLKNMNRNLSQGVSHVKLFEIAKVFMDTRSGDLPEETLFLTGLWTGVRNPVSWHDNGTPCDFYDMKGAMEGLLDALMVGPCEFHAPPKEECFYTRPGHTARMQINGTVLGTLGELHPRVVKSFDLKQTAFIFEMDLGTLIPLIPDGVSVMPLPKFPAVSRDFTLIVNKNIASYGILEKINGLAEPLLESVYLFDMFEGKQIPPGKKSLSFRIRYRSNDRTLADDEINMIHKTIADRIIDQFNAALPT